MPQPRVQAYEIFSGGEDLAVEDQKVRPDEFKQLDGWYIGDDRLPETAPGYALDFEIPKRRQFATMEGAVGDSLLETWTGDATANTTSGQRRFGFQSLKHTHDAANTKTSIYARGVGSFSDMASFDTTDEINLFFYHTIRAEITSITIQFLEAGGDYFQLAVDISDLTAGDNQASALTYLFSDLTTSGTPDWAMVRDVKVITISSDVTAVSFDDFYAESVTASEPITGGHSFEIPGSSKHYRMIATGDMVYSIENGTPVKRDAKLTVAKMVKMRTIGDNVVWANASNQPRRWRIDEDSALDVGVPVPSSGMTGADGGITPGADVEAGAYASVVTFDMGVHGEGNPSVPTAVYNVAANGSEIDYAVVPLGPPGTVGRLIYRSQKDNTAGPFYLDKTITDNTTTSISSGNSDAVCLAAGEVDINGNKPPVLSQIELAQGVAHGILTVQPWKVPYSDNTFAPNRTWEQWPAQNVYDNLNPNDGDILVGLRAHREFVYAYKRFGAFIIDPRQQATRQISTVYGAVSERCIVDRGEDIFFWSGPRGPIRVAGTSFQELGRKVRSKDGPYPGVEDVSNNIVRTNNTPEITTSWDTQAEWQTWTPTDANATDIPGALTPDRGGDDYERINIAKGKFHSFAQTGLTAAGPGPATNIVDGANSTYYDVIQLRGTAATVNFIVDLGSAKTLTHLSIRYRHGDPDQGSAISGWQNFNVQSSSSPSGPWANVYANTNLGSTDNDTILTIDHTFSPRTARYWRLHIDETNRLDRVIALRIFEFRLFEQGFVADSSAYSPVTNAGSAISEWLRVLVDMDQILPLGIRVFMRSSASVFAAADASPAWTPAAPGGIPDTATAPPSQYYQFLVLFHTNGHDRPRLDRLLLAFRFTDINQPAPIFESAAIYYEGRYWFNYVSKQDTTPRRMWRLGRFIEPSEDHDYRMSCWFIHDRILYSGSAIDGKVFRHVYDAAGNKITSREGRAIVPEFETGQSPLGVQFTRKSLRELVVSARNEHEEGQEILVNGEFEEWFSFGINAPIPIQNTSGPVPVGWDIVAPPAQKFGRGMLQETDRANVFSGQYAMLLDGRDVSAGGPQSFTSQKVSLANSTLYNLRVMTKNIGDPCLLRIRTADGYILASDGTWDPANTGLTLPDNGNSYGPFDFTFMTQTDVANRLPVTIEFIYPALGSIQGRTWIDNVSLRLGSARTRRLLIRPVYDGIIQSKVFVMDLVSQEPGVITKRFRLDKAGIQNVGFKVRQEEVDGGAKVLGLLVKYAVEQIRSEERV